MNRRIFLFYAFCFLLSTFGLSAQDTWIQTYQPFGDVDSYGVYYLNICQDEGFAVNGYYHIYDPEFGIDEDWAYLMKVDSEGNFEWAYEETELGFNDHRSPCFVETDDGGFLMVVTSIWGGTALVKLDSEGNRLWDVDGQDFYPHSMDKTNDGNIILAGRMNGLPAIRKITPESEIFWTQTYSINGENSATLRSITSTTDDKILAVGNIYLNGENSDALIIKCESDGDSLWTRTFDGFESFDNSNCVIETNEEKIFVVGYSGNPFSGPLLWMLDPFGETIWIEYETAHVGFAQFSAFNTPDNNLLINGGDMYKVDYDYNLIWEQDFACGGEKALKFIDNEYMVCPGILIENYSHYILIRKTDLEGNVSISEEEINNIYNMKLHCYPNPFNPIIDFEINSEEFQNLKLEIYNIKGQIIEIIPVYEKNICWNATKHASGIYFACLKQNSKIIQPKKLL